jgi:hypothetical protein
MVWVAFGVGLLLGMSGGLLARGLFEMIHAERDLASRISLKRTEARDNSSKMLHL